MNSEFLWSQWRGRGAEDEWEIEGKEMCRPRRVQSTEEVSEAVMTKWA